MRHALDNTACISTAMWAIWEKDSNKY